MLRARRIPYVAVNEARKALLPDRPRGAAALQAGSRTVKSFDFVAYGRNERGLDGGVLAEIKGRRVRPTPSGVGRLESWATRDDVSSLLTWSSLFGDAFVPALVFVYWLDTPPRSSLFEDTWVFKDRWYAIRAVRADEYATHQKTRSAKWGTVHLSAADFDRLSRPLAAAPSEVMTPVSNAPGRVSAGERPARRPMIWTADHDGLGSGRRQPGADDPQGAGNAERALAGSMPV